MLGVARTMRERVCQRSFRNSGCLGWRTRRTQARLGAARHRGLGDDQQVHRITFVRSLNARSVPLSVPVTLLCPLLAR